MYLNDQKNNQDLAGRNVKLAFWRTISFSSKLYEPVSTFPAAFFDVEKGCKSKISGSFEAEVLQLVFLEQMVEALVDRLLRCSFGLSRVVIGSPRDEDVLLR